MSTFKEVLKRLLITVIVIAAITLAYKFYDNYQKTEGYPDPYEISNREFVLKSFKPELLFLLGKELYKNELSYSQIRQAVDEKNEIYKTLSDVFEKMQFEVRDIFLTRKEEDIKKVECTADIVCGNNNCKIPIVFSLQRNDDGQVRIEWQKLTNSFGSFYNDQVDVVKFSEAIKSIVFEKM